jgi:hypothetical protein
LSDKAYDRAVAELFQTPLDRFVAERKRLAAALKSDGDAAGATELAAMRRPTTSAWTVNQLWWEDRDEFDELLATATRVRKGDREATAAYREALGMLRKKAAAILQKAGHGANETILRRVTTTLTALAATGGFDPDPPGTLSADRDPPGFETVESRPVAAKRPAPALRKVPASKDARADAKARAAAEAAARADRERREAEAARRRAERHRVETKLRTAQADAAKRDRGIERARRELADAEAAAADVRERIARLERDLRALEDEEE